MVEVDCECILLHPGCIFYFATIVWVAEFRYNIVITTKEASTYAYDLTQRISAQQL